MHFSESAGFDPNKTLCGPNGLPPLHFAVGLPGQRLPIDCLEFALGLDGLDVNRQTEPQTHMSMDGILGAISHGTARATYFTVGGAQTALHVAAGSGKSLCVRKLVADKRIDLNLAGQTVGMPGRQTVGAKTSPLFTAHEGGHLRCVRMLQAAGAAWSTADTLPAMATTRPCAHPSCAVGCAVPAKPAASYVEGVSAATICTGFPGACEVMWYCSPEHQFSHWAVHRVECEGSGRTTGVLQVGPEGEHPPSCARKVINFWLAHAYLVFGLLALGLLFVGWWQDVSAATYYIAGFVVVLGALPFRLLFPFLFFFLLYLLWISSWTGIAVLTGAAILYFSIGAPGAGAHALL